MYEITTTLGKKFKIDSDELSKIAKASPDDLVFLRQAAVLRKQVGLIEKIEDEHDVLKLVTMSDEEWLTAKETARLQDNFAELRQDYQNKRLN